MLNYSAQELQFPDTEEVLTFHIKLYLNCIYLISFVLFCQKYAMSCAQSLKKGRGTIKQELVIKP